MGQARSSTVIQHELTLGKAWQLTINSQFPFQKGHFRDDSRKTPRPMGLQPMCIFACAAWSWGQCFGWLGMIMLITCELGGDWGMMIGGWWGMISAHLQAQRLRAFCRGRARYHETFPVSCPINWLVVWITPRKWANRWPLGYVYSVFTMENSLFLIGQLSTNGPSSSIFHI